MLPVALRVPLWWVTRWAVRLLTGVAVAAACTLGVGALPAGAAGPSDPVEIHHPVDGPLTCLPPAVPEGLDTPVATALPSSASPADPRDGLAAGPVPPVPGAKPPTDAVAAVVGRVGGVPAGAYPSVRGPRAPPAA